MLAKRVVIPPMGTGTARRYRGDSRGAAWLPSPA
jgi:hypothetical protein